MDDRSRQKISAGGNFAECRGEAGEPLLFQSWWYA
jgi:hypothetical protein